MFLSIKVRFILQLHFYPFLSRKFSNPCFLPVLDKALENSK